MDAIPSESKSNGTKQASDPDVFDPLEYAARLSSGPSIESRNLSSGKTERWMVDNFDVEQAMKKFAMQLSDEAKQSVKVVGKKEKADYDRAMKLQMQEKFKTYLLQNGRVRPGFVKWISEDGGETVDGMYGSGTAETGWLPPNTISIEEARKRQILMEAKAAVCCIKGPPPDPKCCGRPIGEPGLLNTLLCIKCRPCHSSADTHIAAGGLGTMLYFRLQRTLMIAFAVATCVILPAIFFTSQGSRIRPDQMDLLQLSSYSIANVGNQPDASFETYTFVTSLRQDYSWSLAAVRLREESSQKEALSPAPTTYELPGLGQVGAGAALAACGFLDAAAVCVFLVAISMYYRMVRIKANVPGPHRKVAMQDYSVKITGLPSDVQIEELRAHFSNLYALDQPDWRLQHWWRKIWGVRVPLDQNPYDKPASRKFDNLAPDDWGVVREIRNARNLNPPVTNVEHLYEKFHSDVADKFMGGWIADVELVECLGEMHNRFAGFAELEHEHLQNKAQMMKFHPSSQYHNEVKFKRAQKKVAAVAAKLEAARLNILRAYQTDTCAAFLVFNNNESKQRCLDDFQGSNSYFWWLLQPQQLRFTRRNGQVEQSFRISVEEAPDPTDILWENVEIRHDERNVRSSIVLLLTTLVIMISVISLSFGETLENEMEGLVPQQELCQVQIPAAATGSYQTLNMDLFLVRNPEAETDACDEGQFYISVNHEGQGELEQGVPDTCFGFCVDPNDDKMCILGAGLKTPSLVQDVEVASDKLLPEYSAKDLVACTCMDMLRRSTVDGLISGPQELLSKHAVMCEDLVNLFLQSRGLIIFAGIALVVVNSLLEHIITKLNDFHLYQSRSQAKFSLLLKLFLAQFVTTALVAVLVNSSLPLFDGEFNDFTLEWHVQVGAQMMATLFMNMLGSHAMTVLNCLVWQPIRRYIMLTREKHSELTQQGLLKKVAPPPFYIEAKYASMLSSVGVIMLFSTAYPILYVLGLATLAVAFYAEKLLILRFYKKPEASDPRQAEFAVMMLKLIVFLHSATGFWMLGADGVVAHQWFGSNHVWQTAGDQSTVDKTGQEQQQQNNAINNGDYQSPDAAAKAQRDSAVAVGQLAAALKEWELEPAWDSLGLTQRVAAIAGIGLGLVTLSFILRACWGSPVCTRTRYAWQVFRAQDFCSCENITDPDDDPADEAGESKARKYETRDGVVREVKITHEQEKSVFEQTACLNPPFTDDFYRMLPPLKKSIPKPSGFTRLCLRMNFRPPCAAVCFSEREIRRARRWARHQAVLARKSSNRFANKLKDSSSDGEVNQGADDAPRESVRTAVTVEKVKSHFQLGELHGMPLWRPLKGHKISKGQKSAGWLLIKDKQRHPRAVQRVREWNDASALASAQSKCLARKSVRPGDHYTTWELIATYGLHTYDITKNPHYQGFVTLLLEARALKQKAVGGDGDFVFDPRVHRADRIKRALYRSSAAFLVGIRDAILSFMEASRRWYISARGGDPNAAEQAEAVDSDGSDSTEISTLSSTSNRLRHKHKNSSDGIQAAAPPSENYEKYLARRSPSGSQTQTLKKLGYRRVADAKSAKVAPALTLGVLAEGSAENPVQTERQGSWRGPPASED